VTNPEPFRVAAVQAAPVFLDLHATLDKACDLIRQAAEGGAQLVTFPEAFISGYPVWVWFIPSGKTHPLRDLYTRLHRSAVTIPGPAIDRLRAAAAEAEVAVVVGVNERNAEGSDATLYNTLVFIDAEGRLLGRHRKFVPTAGERLVWGQGDGSDLEVYSLPFARVGGLLCWENYMPLARYTLSAWGEQVHVAPTWDRGEPWISSMRHIAKEGRCFVIGVCQAFHVDDVPDDLDFKSEYLGGMEGWINPGLSVIVDPDGKLVAGPLEAEEGILYADVQPHQLVGPKWQLDSAGHYARPDVFELRFHRRPTPFLQVVEDDPDETRSETVRADAGSDGTQ
jgi:nitrilase